MLLNDKVIFIHNPRTSGMSITGILTDKDRSIGSIQRRHLTAARVRKIVGKETWENRYKFSVVRNPWSRFVSLWFSFKKLPINKFKLKKYARWAGVEKHVLLDAQSIPTLDGWINWAEEINLWEGLYKIPQVRWCDDIDRVFRFEQPQEIDDFLKVKRPIVNNLTKKHWETYYNEYSYDWVAKVFAQDIERFNY